MNVAEVVNIFKRIERLSDRLSKKAGEGYRWNYKFPDGLEVTYILKNVRSLDEIEDEISNAFIWLWNLKDYLKELSKSKGEPYKDIEIFVDDSDYLAVCSDVANRLKHGILKKSRSHKFAELGSLNVNCTQEHISEIKFTEKEVEFNITKPNEIQLTISIYDKDGEKIGDGFKFLAGGISEWENIFLI